MADVVRVATWNLWGRNGPWEAREDAITRVRAAEAPDLVCLQESWIGGDGPSQAARLGATLGLQHTDADRPEAGRQTVSAGMESFEATASSADWDHADHFYMILTDQPGAKSWPIENPTFILMHKQPADPAASGSALKFFKWR